MNQETSTLKYTVFCFACGSALYQHEISAQITGQTVDYNERIAIQNTNYYLCNECLEKSKVFLNGGMKKAIERREEQRNKLQEIDMGSMILVGS